MNSRLTHITRQADADEILRAVVPRTHLADDSFYDFGTVGAFEDRKREKRERRYRVVFRVGMAFVIFALGFMAGINLK